MKQQTKITLDPWDTNTAQISGTVRMKLREGASDKSLQFKGPLSLGEALGLNRNYGIYIEIPLNANWQIDVDLSWDGNISYSFARPDGWQE